MVATCSLSCCCLAALLVVDGSMTPVLLHTRYSLRRSIVASDSLIVAEQDRHIIIETHTYTEIGKLYSPKFVRDGMG